MDEILSENSILPELTKELVSKLIGKKVQSFTIGAGTAPGDNYMSNLYSLKCVLAPETENDIVSVMYGIVKCYPAHPARQAFLNRSNLFWNELRVYKDFIPGLKEMLAESGVEMTLPFAPFIHGQSPNFGTGKVNDEMIKKYAGKVFNPFEIFILMVDMKRTYGFRMADRLIGLRLEEMNLVMREYAKIHALSWAYKCKNGTHDFSVKFPFFKLDVKDHMDWWLSAKTAGLQSTYDIMSQSGMLTPQESGILDGLSKTKERLKEILECMYSPGESGSKLEAFLRVKKTDEEKRADDVPWEVVVHGDCWLNNLLFRYDAVTQKALELVVIDLQMMRQACPTSDLGYAIYSSTSPKLRQIHLKDWLRLYTNQFMCHCDSLGVPYLPGFSYDSLVRRFHRSKVVGFIMGMIILPLLLNDPKHAQDLDSFGTDMGLGEIMRSSLGPTLCDNVVYKQRLYALCKEMYEDGVI